MPRKSSKSSKIALLFAAASMMFVTVACDPAEQQFEERAAESPETNPDGIQAKRGDHGKRSPADRLCAKLECSEAQAAAISELFVSRHENRDRADHQARRAARAEANKVIADAFRAADFDPAVLDRAKPERDRSDHQARMLAFATELHGILTPEQRATLADKIEARGPMFLGRHHGKKHRAKKHRGNKHRGKAKRGDKAKRDPAERLARKVDRFCAPVSCTDEQKTQLSATFEAVHQAHRDARAERRADKPDFTALADAFRAETLDEAKLRAHMVEAREHMQERKADHRQQFGNVVAEIHDVLTAEQRAIVADKIETKGLRAAMGHKKRHKRIHKRIDKNAKHGGETEVNAR